MGRIRGKWIKSISKKLVEQYPGKFSKNFKNNKEILEEMGIFDDKVIRNKIAGARTNPPSAMVNDVHRRPLPTTIKIIPIIIKIICKMLTLLFSIYSSPLMFNN